MPWAPSDASGKTKKASTPKKKRQWRDVANSVLAKSGDEGRAIREANAVVGRKRAKKQRPDGVQTEGHAYDWRTRN